MNLVVVSRAKKDLAKIDKKTLKRLELGLNKLLMDPKTVDLKKLQGEVDSWR